MTSIVFTDAALDDLRRLGPAIAPRVLKKVLLLEEDPRAGLPLGGDLTGFRKLIVGNRDWRVVYRIDTRGDVEVCEIWAAGSRSDAEVYAEATARITRAASDRPGLVPLADAISRLGRVAGGVEASDPPRVEPVPDWLADKLVNVAGVSPATVAALSAEDAFQMWNDFITRPR